MAKLPAAGDTDDRTAALVIEFRNVGKTYKSLLGNSVKAVEEFSLMVVEGEILGIAGPNGAGGALPGQIGRRLRQRVCPGGFRGGRRLHGNRRRRMSDISSAASGA